jgi:hypothetical protein
MRAWGYVLASLGLLNAGCAFQRAEIAQEGRTESGNRALPPMDLWPSYAHRVDVPSLPPYANSGQITSQLGRRQSVTRGSPDAEALEPEVMLSRVAYADRTEGALECDRSPPTP